VEKTTTKAMLVIQAQHVNELLKDVGVDIGIQLEFAYGQPRLVASNGSLNLSMRESKPNLEATLYAIRQILYEIGRVQRQEKPIR